MTFWCSESCPLFRGVLYSERPLSEVPLYICCVQVKVRDIHIRYEDSSTNPHSSMAAGITLHSLELKVHWAQHQIWKLSFMSCYSSGLVLSLVMFVHLNVLLCIIYRYLLFIRGL